MMKRQTTISQFYQMDRLVVESGGLSVRFPPSLPLERQNSVEPHWRLDGPKIQLKTVILRCVTGEANRQVWRHRQAKGYWVRSQRLTWGKSTQKANTLQLGLNRLEESLGFPRRRETKASRLVSRHHYVVPYDKEMYSYAGNGLMGFYRKGLPPPLTSNCGEIVLRGRLRMSDIHLDGLLLINFNTYK